MSGNQPTCSLHLFPADSRTPPFPSYWTALFLSRQEDGVDTDGDTASDNDGGEGSGGGGGGGDSTRGSRPKSTGTLDSSGSSRETSPGIIVAVDVEEAVKREIESATGSRLAQVGYLCRGLAFAKILVTPGNIVAMMHV